MQAKLKQNCPYPTLRLFFGREYNKVQWNAIPEGFEEQAKENSFLEVRQDDEIEVSEVSVAPQNAVTPAPPEPSYVVFDPAPDAVELQGIATLENKQIFDANDEDDEVVVAPIQNEVLPTPKRRNRHGSN